LSRLVIADELLVAAHEIHPGYLISQRLYQEVNELVLEIVRHIEANDDIDVVELTVWSSDTGRVFCVRLPPLHQVIVKAPTF
jgi:hypothetical protein